MERIKSHPILDIPQPEAVTFEFEGEKVTGYKGKTIAAALHQAGHPVHSHSLDNRKRSLECGIGKCGACEMLVDGDVQRICMTLVNDVKQVTRISENYVPKPSTHKLQSTKNVYRVQVAIVGSGPAGLAARELLNQSGITNLVIDANDRIGGQFLMQTHRFFFFEKELKYGGLRGFDIATKLSGSDKVLSTSEYRDQAIFLDSVVWDIMEGNRLACKNTRTGEIFYVDCDYFVVATGAVPFLPPFENDDLPGVYTAAVVQKMMNTELTLLGKKVLTVGAGNIGYLTSYQLMQAGAQVKAIIEAQSSTGGFPVQANRVRRLGIPILTSHILLKAVPNANNDGVIGAIIAKCENFKPIPGTEQLISDIDTINICTGLIPDNALLVKGQRMFGIRCFGVGDAMRIGEGTSAVLRGKQAAYEIMEDLGKGKHNEFLQISKEYIDSQQHPIKVIEAPFMPTIERMEKPFVQIDCLYGFACNPCQFACKYGAIVKTSSSDVPHIDFDKCIGCMQCISLCPGLAIFGYNVKTSSVFLPVEFPLNEKEEVWLVDNDANKVATGTVERITKNSNKTHLARIKVNTQNSDELLKIRGYILKNNFPEAVKLTPAEPDHCSQYVCHCEDVDMNTVMKIVGERNFVTVEEIKHTTHLGMGPCRGKRCFLRLRQLLKSKGIGLVGDANPRAPLSNQILMSELYPTPNLPENLITKVRKTTEVPVLIAGGGIAGSSLFRYFAEAGQKPILLNSGFGASWANIAAGRPAFSVPELSEIASQNLEMFKQLHEQMGIDFLPTNYITFAHDEKMHQALTDSMKWQRNARMLTPKEIKAEVSPYYNEKNNKYLSALKSADCWQASPGKTVDALRNLGLAKGGTVHELAEVVDLYKSGKVYHVIVKQNNEYHEYTTECFVNAMGSNGDKFARKVGIETNLFAVKHQAFITRRMPMLGVNGRPLDMLIDRRKYKGFGAVYGQQLASTGQIIGCASPLVEHNETDKTLRTNSQEFMHICAEVFVDWIPELSSAGFQAMWAGYYIEPRMMIDPSLGLFLGMKGQGFMLSQYIAKVYVEKFLGKEVPAWFERLKPTGDGLAEGLFK